MRTANRVRLASILAVGAFGLHQLRYLITAGGTTEGHRYMGWIAFPLALVVGSLSALLVRALEGVERAIAVFHAERPRRSRAPAVRGRALSARGLMLALAPLAFGPARRPPLPAPA